MPNIPQSALELLDRHSKKVTTISSCITLTCKEGKVVQPPEVNTTSSDPSSAPTPGNGKTGLDTLARSPDSIKIEMPLDIVMSLLRQDELEKLQKYVAVYLGKHWQP